MSNTHDGVSCDNCMKSNFSGKRYKCLICYDFDLCSTCYDQSQATLLALEIASSSSSSTCSIQDDTNLASSSKSTKKSKSNKLRRTPEHSSLQVVRPPPVAQATSSNVQINQSSHLNSHAMQCILTRSDHELFYGSAGAGGIICDFTIEGGVSGIEQQSFTCPYCAKFGFSETSLCKHLSTQHSNLNSNPSTASIAAPGDQAIAKKEVVCPICAVVPSSNGGDPNHLTDNLLQHINMEHIINNSSSSNKNSNKNLDESMNDIGANPLTASSNIVGSSSTNAVAAAAAALRFSRRLNYSQSASRSSLASQSGITIGNNSTTSRANGTLMNRYAFQFGQNSTGNSSQGSSALSSFMRSNSHANSGLDSLHYDSASLSNQMDPIAELLSQLTGVRRAGSATHSASSQLQQLQMQLNRERESLQQQSAAAAVVAAAGGGAGSGGSRHGHIHHHLFSGGIGGNMTKSQLLNSLSQSKSNNQNNNPLTTQNSANQALQTANNITTAFSNQVLELPPNYLLTQTLTPRDPRYLLSKYDFNNVENQPPNPDLNLINQSLFINDILTALLTNQLTANEPPGDPDFNSNNNTNSNMNILGHESEFFKANSETGEDDLGDEELLKMEAQSNQICMKNKTSPVNSPEESKLLEL